MNTELKFTLQQLANWKAYERVRKGGKYNMFDPRALDETDLSAEDYRFVMKHYSELRDATKAGTKKEVGP